MKRKQTKAEKLLTEVELEMMQVLWKKGASTVNEVQSSLSSDRKLAYTSVSTMLRILEQKGIVKSEKEGRGHVYSPLLKREDYEKKSVQHLVKNVFDSAPGQLVQRLLEVEALSADEIQSIRKLLKEKYV